MPGIWVEMIMETKNFRFDVKRPDRQSKHNQNIEGHHKASHSDLLLVQLVLMLGLKLMLLFGSHVVLKFPYSQFTVTIVTIKQMTMSDATKHAPLGLPFCSQICLPFF
jgi:hypothetical protein